MRVAHREITKKHLRRIAEKAVKEAGGGGDVYTVFETADEKCIVSSDDSQFIRNNIKTYTWLADSDDFYTVHEKNENVYEVIRFYLPTFSANENWDFTNLQNAKAVNKTGYDETQEKFTFKTDDTQGYLAFYTLLYSYFKCTIGSTGAYISKYDKIGGVALDNLISMKGFTFTSEVNNQDSYLMYCEKDLRWKLFNESEVNENENE